MARFGRSSGRICHFSKAPVAQTVDLHDMSARLDRLAREARKTNNECIVISHSIYRFIRHELIYAAALPPPGEDAKALGEKRFQMFLDSVAKMMAKSADNENEPSAASNVEEA
jgi:hypothetical protein